MQLQKESSIDPITKIINEMYRKPSSLLNSCLNAISSLRTIILHYSRVITLAPLANKRSLKPTFEKFPTKFKDILFRPIELPSFLGFAQMTQNTGFLLCYICEKPEVLATALLAKTKSSNFKYLINCSIPSVFGYFCSLEHLQIASRFYLSVVQQFEPSKAIKILTPLMNNPATFRFIESVCSQFCDGLAINKIESFDDDKFCHHFCDFLVELIRKSAQLLPEQVLSILQKVGDHNWTIEHFMHLFLDKFLWKSLRLWILYSEAKNHYKPLETIINLTSNNDRLLRIIYKSIQQAYPLFYMPSIYTIFGHNYLDFFVSAYDIHLIAHLLDECKMMPDTVTLHELKKVPKGSIYYFYSCQVYPHIPPSITVIDDPLFNINTVPVKQFEKLLFTLQHKSDINQWKTVIESSISFILNPIINESVSEASPLRFPERFSNYQKFFNLPILNKKIYLCLMDTYVNQWLQTDQRFLAILNHLDQQFNKLLDDISKSPEAVNFAVWTSSIHKSFRPTLLNTIKKVRCIEQSSFYDQFKIFQNSMSALESIFEAEQIPEERKNIYPVIFQQCRENHFLSSFIKLNAFAMKNNVFEAFFKDDEEGFLQLWLTTQEMILNCLNKDCIFLKGYNDLQLDFDNEGYKIYGPAPSKT